MASPSSKRRSEQALWTSSKGSVAISECGQKDLSAVRIRLCGEKLELLGERQLLSAGVFRLFLSHHVDHFDAAQHSASTIHGLEPQHWANPPLDGPMILFDPIVEVGALTDPDRLRAASRPILEPAFRVAAQNGLSVGLAAVDHDPLGPTMMLEGLAQKLFGGCQIAPLAEPELDRVAVAVNGAIEIPPLASDPDICFIDVPPGSDGSLAGIEAFQTFGRVSDNLPVNGRMVDRDAALSHHLLEIPQAQIVGEIPTNAEQDHGSIKMPALEHPCLRSCNYGHRS
jgi:hypothetical protein